MRRIVIAFAGTITGLVLLLAYPTSQGQTLTSTGTSTADPTADATEQADATATTPSETGATADAGASATPSEEAATSGTFTGDVVQTRFGPVQVEITVVDGIITAADAIQHPTGHESDEINAYAVPILSSEAVEVQSADLSLISGATYTSEAYMTSLQSALDQAGL